MRTMDIDRFNAIRQSCRKARPLMFAEEAEAASTDKEIAAAERALALKLPPDYKTYLRHYGGGYVGSINVFSVNEQSEWNLSTRRTALNLPEDFLAITDDETGGYYGFRVRGGVCEDSVYYLQPDDGGSPMPSFPSFFDYVARVGLGAEIN